LIEDMYGNVVFLRAIGWRVCVLGRHHVTVRYHAVAAAAVVVVAIKH